MNSVLSHHLGRPLYLMGSVIRVYLRKHTTFHNTCGQVEWWFTQRLNGKFACGFFFQIETGNKEIRKIILFPSLHRMYDSLVFSHAGKYHKRFGLYARDTQDVDSEREQFTCDVHLDGLWDMADD